MFLLIVIIVLLIPVYFLLNKKQYQITFGKHTRQINTVINKHSYYIEEVKFETYQQALTNYFKIVEQIAHQDTIVETKYDLYDWTYSYIRFKDRTISLKHFRNYKTVQVAISYDDITIKEIEYDNPSLSY